MIYLDRSDLYGLVKTDRLLVKDVPQVTPARRKGLLRVLFGPSRNDSLPETYLFQLDRNGDTIPSAIALRVNRGVVVHDE